MKVALTDPQGVVVNVIAWPDDRPVPAEWAGLPAHDVTGEHVGPRWTLDGDTWHPPVPPPDPSAGDHLDPQIGAPDA